MSHAQMIVGVLEIVFTLLPTSTEIVAGVSKLLSSPRGSLPIPRTVQDRRFMFFLNDNLNVLANEQFEFGQMQGFRFQLSADANGIQGSPLFGELILTFGAVFRQCNC